MNPRLAIGLSTLFLAVCQSAMAQASCSSDGQSAFHFVQDRFINADCEACWTQAPATVVDPQAVVLDWIVPGTRGDDAPLSAAARPEGLERMRTKTTSATSTPQRPQITPQLRVARGPVLSGYVGTSIALPPSAMPVGPFTAWLVLVETIPAGQDGTPITRNLVRNALALDWNATVNGWQELRAMSVPEGAKAERLQVVGWVEDPSGQPLTAVQSHCSDEAE
jgi:hypothetical protein